jgi:hypothetical protein
MDTFLNKYFELDLSGCELDIVNDTKLRLIKAGNWIITSSLVNTGIWSVTIALDIDLEYEVKLDITRYVKRVMDVDIDELIVNYTSDEFIDLVKCMSDLNMLREGLAKLIKGYLPIVCRDCFIMNWKRDQRDSYAFVMDVLLKECFSGVWNVRMESTLKPLPGFIAKIDSALFTRICTGLELIRNMDCDGKTDTAIECEMYMLSWIAYEVIRCALMNFNIYSLESIDSNSVIGKSGVSIYKVNYNNPAVCEKFDTLMSRVGHMGYHGSSIMNWYSIVYNGLFVAKGSHVVNGASYGTGIYLSDSSRFSMGYSTLNNGTAGNIILGVFQVDADISTFKKTSNIYVVPDERKICLRYLIYMKPSYSGGVCGCIDNYFISGEMVKSVQKVDTVINNAWSRRVMGEIRALHARDGIMGDDGLRYLVNDCDSMNVIVLSLCRDTFSDSLLGKDMDTMGIDYIKMEIRLPVAYPFEPPFIRVLSPKFAFRKGHVTIGGSICMDLLTKQRWVPSMSISKIMITIVQNMIVGDGRLEPGGKNYVYSLHEAQSAFTRMLATHSGEW